MTQQPSEYQDPNPAGDAGNGGTLPLASSPKRRSRRREQQSSTTSQRPRHVLKARFLSFLTGIFIGREGCGCCVCFGNTDDVVPFWTQDDTEANTSAHDEYSNDTFELGSERTATAAAAASRTTTANGSAAAGEKSRQTRNGYGATSPNNNNHLRKTSESESEDSFSVAASEVSEASDVESRIRMLSAELKRRKMEAERLKRESERKRKQRLKKQEEQLKLQIESYDKYIDQYKSDLTRSPDISDHHGNTAIRPQIKPPSQKKVSDRPVSVDRSRPDPDSTASRASADGDQLSPRKPKELPPRDKITKDKLAKAAAPPPKRRPPPPEPKSAVSTSAAVSEQVSLADSTKAETETSVPMLQLEEEEEPKLPAVTPRSARDSRQDSARSVSEIPEDVISDYVPTPRTETEDLKLEDSKREDSKHEDSKRESEKPLSVITESVTSRTADSSSKSSSVSEYSDDYTTNTSSRTATSTRSSDKSSSSENTVTFSTKSKLDKKSESPDDVSDEAIVASEEEEEESQSTVSEVLMQLKFTEPVIATPRDPMDDFNIGDRVLVSGSKPGTLRFKGFTKFAPGCFAGVELDKPTGDNDGCVDSMEYFKCSPKHGVFVAPDLIAKLTDEDVIQPEPPKPKVDKKDQATNIAVKHLLDEALSQMMSIRNRKRDAEVSEESKQESTAEPSTPRSEKPKDPDFEDRPETSLGHLADIGPPAGLMDDDIYDFDADDNWDDDDLGFPTSVTSKPKPEGVNPQELRLDLDKLDTPPVVEETIFYVPNTQDEVSGLVDRTIDHFWELRRYGEPWTGVDMPTEFLATSEGDVVAKRSRRVYTQLVFDLAKQVLCDMYRDEEEDTEPPVWSKQRLPRKRYHRERSPPTMVDDLKPIVQTHVQALMGFNRKSVVSKNKSLARKKKDHVDQILVQELREDEPQWVNYDDAELEVKNRLVDTLFDSLLADTAFALGPALKARHT